MMMNMAMIIICVWGQRSLIDSIGTYCELVVCSMFNQRIHFCLMLLSVFHFFTILRISRDTVRSRCCSSSIKMNYERESSSVQRIQQENSLTNLITFFFRSYCILVNDICLSRTASYVNCLMLFNIFVVRRFEGQIEKTDHRTFSLVYLRRFQRHRCSPLFVNWHDEWTHSFVKYELEARRIFIWTCTEKK